MLWPTKVTNLVLTHTGARRRFGTTVNRNGKTVEFRLARTRWLTIWTVGTLTGSPYGRRVVLASQNRPLPIGTFEAALEEETRVDCGREKL